MQMFGRAYTAASELLALAGRGLSAFRHKSIGGARPIKERIPGLVGRADQTAAA